MKRILFVDDEPNVLEGLQRMLFPLRKEYKMAFASSGQEALGKMEKQEFDVLVSDMRMPGMDGAQLLAEVKAKHPGTLRFILTGQSGNANILRSVGDAHQFLSKPCQPKTLKACVDRAFALRDLLESTSLKSLVAQVGTLPPVPQIYAALCEELRSPEGSISNVGRIIESDVAMTAKILQLVNSAFFSVRQHVTTAPQAASLLGFETIKSLVLMTDLYSNVDKNRLPEVCDVNAIRAHSLAVGNQAKAIAHLEGASKELLNDSFTAGLLHDTGYLMLAHACPEDYGFVHDYATVNDVSFVEAEYEILGCTHAEVGAYLLGIWGLPSEIIEAIAYHHKPGDFPDNRFSALTAVHIADSFSKSSEKLLLPQSELDRDYLEKVGVLEHFSKWEALCSQALEEGEES